MTTVDVVRRLLSSASAEPLCDACLAFACATSLMEMRAATEDLVTSDPSFHRGGSCGSCRRTVQATFYRDAASSARRNTAAS